jgi:hypothetical protein
MVKYTDHIAGGLRKSPVRLGNTFDIPPAWEYPAYIDGRPYLLPADDQGKSSKCAAYAVAGIEEALEWFKTGKKKTVDPDPIYARAKELDDEAGEDNGTTLESIIKAARSLHYFEDVEVFDVHNDLDLRYALHRFPLVLVGLEITDGWNKVGDDGHVPDGSRKLGGHAMVDSFYNSYGPGGINSWGTSWGDSGRWYISWKQFREQFMCAKGFSIIR